MGYFANGFVFTDQPDFESASKAIPDRLARGYKHNQQPIWLLDLWKPRGKQQLQRFPFCDPAAKRFRTDLAMDAPTSAFLASLESLRQAIDPGIGGTEISGVHIAIAIASAARCPAFFFAADDDGIDMACNARAGSLISFGCRFPRLSVEYVSGKSVVTPLNYLEDDEESAIEELVAKLATVPGIAVLSPRDIEGGQVFYENPTRHWPNAAGDPSEILGIGTWDMFLNFEQDFAIVFETLGG